jgi:nucleotide-binding universal stress UspA family protein
MHRPIVVPVDTSVYSGSSLSLARSLAHGSGRAVHLVRVDTSREAGCRRRESWERYLDSAGLYFFTALGAHRVRTALLPGEGVVETIAAYAGEQDAAMVVLAGNGVKEDGYSRGVATAARLGRGSGVPVLLVHPESDAAAYPHPPFRHLVLALSATEVDDGIVEAVDRLAGSAGTFCTLLHVVARSRPGQVASAAGYLEGHAEALAERGHTVEIRVMEHDDPGEAIAGVVRASGAELLVVGASRHDAHRDAAPGSVPSTLFRRLRLPMLVVSRGARGRDQFVAGRAR